jgi:hypothetical protein
MRRYPISTIRARIAVSLLALWLPAGPLLSAAAACERAAASRCSHRTARIGCHETPKRPSCHESAEAKTAPVKRACCCAKATIAATRCGCRHDGGAVAVTIDTTLPRSPFVFSLALPVRDVDSRAPLARDAVPNAPPVPPPRASSQPRSI